MVFERTRDGFVVSDDPTRLDFEVIHGYLRTAYWCAGIPREVVERGARHSLTFGLYVPAWRQVGYGRASPTAHRTRTFPTSSCSRPSVAAAWAFSW